MLSRRNGRMGLYAAAVLAGAGLMANAGDLDPPPGPVGPTMVTLDEIDGKLDQILSDLGARNAAAAARGSLVRIFLRAQNIAGDSDFGNNRDWIELTSAGIGISGPDPMSGGVLTPRTLDELHISGVADSGLTELLSSQTRGRALANLEVEWVETTPQGPTTFLSIEMNECFVSSSKITLDQVSMEPGFSMTIAPSSVVTVRYTQLDPNGNPIGQFQDTHVVQ